uniref:Nbr1 FW domain-containing protein n=1 Tax=Rhizophagus irregularis (strain DAOM 181602 / DAOM 197198 / MUCL 43194) TaxID=747089 RepID=U9TG26_RHIID
MLNARFIEDVNVPDGTILSPQTKFLKIWKMSNNGSITWPESTALHFADGERMFNNDLIKSSLATSRSNSFSDEEELHCPRCTFYILPNRTSCEMCGTNITRREHENRSDEKPKIHIGPVEVGKDVGIAVDLQAPSKPGKYVSSVED